MTVKEKVENLIKKYETNLEKLDNQEKAIYEEIKDINTKMTKLKDKKADVLNSDSLNINELSKIDSKIQKANEKIRDKQANINLIRETRANIEEKFKKEIEPLGLELRAEYWSQLRAVGFEVQNIIDQATMKQIEMWDIQAEFSKVVREMNSIGNGNFSSSLPVVEMMNDSVANVMKIVPLEHVERIKTNGIENYNTVYGKYGRMIR